MPGPQTFRLGQDGEKQFIECLLCGLKSLHPKDIEYEYCPEWPLDKAQYSLAQPLTARWIWQGSEDHGAA
jgi:hypothetical protein